MAYLRAPEVESKGTFDCFLHLPVKQMSNTTVQKRAAHFFYANDATRCKGMPDEVSGILTAVDCCSIILPASTSKE